MNVKNLFILLALSTQASLAQTTYPIFWNSLENVTLNGDNALTRINGTGWDGGAAGDNLLQPNTDGYALIEG